MVRLDIISDPVCPWCYIGKARLDRALERAPDMPFLIEWHPFELNPDLPREGMDRQAYLTARFGGRDGILAAYRPVVEAAEAAGLPLRLDLIRRQPNSRDAHRLIHWAGLEGRQTPVVAALFRAFFAEGRDIGAPEVLCDIAAEAGLDSAVIARLLAGDADRETIAERAAHSRRMGVTGVPTFIVGGRHAVPGAQPTALWDRVIAELAGRDAPG